MELVVDKNRGSGYFSSHMWPFGLVLVLTGVVAGIISCIVDPPPTSSSNNAMGYSLLDLEEPMGDKMEVVGSQVKDAVEHFITESSDDDMFCYVPLNRCSLVLIVVGFVFVGLDSIILK